ncbi:hypothetical protein [Staphylococcus gallinarum]|uniref:hypothetical protein n=1 Tax=Staphylococcus gallinarum TaxID=1293 RepID=UPI0030C2FBEE
MWTTIVSSGVLITIGSFVGKKILGQIKFFIDEQHKYKNELKKLSAMQEQQIELLKYQQTLDKQAMYFNNYFDKYSTIYEKMNKIDQTIRFFVYWEGNIKTFNYAVANDTEVFKGFEHKLEEYNLYKDMNVIQNMNLAYQVQKLLDYLIDLREFFLKNKLILEKEEQELITKYLEIANSSYQMLAGFEMYKQEMKNQNKEKEVCGEFLKGIHGKIVEHYNEIQTLDRKIENQFKSKFYEENK